MLSAEHTEMRAFCPSGGEILQMSYATSQPKHSTLHSVRRLAQDFDSLDDVVLGDYFQALFGFKKSEGYWQWFTGNIASGGAAGATSLLFVYSLDYARTRLANDAKIAKTSENRQFEGLVDVYKKTLASDGVAGLYRGFVPSVLGIIVYRGLYFGLYDSLSARWNQLSRYLLIVR